VLFDPVKLVYEVESSSRTNIGGHTMNRHKEGPKRNPRSCDVAGGNRRSGATDIIEVTHTSNIEKLFNLLVCSNIICCTCIFCILHCFSMNSV
jgi:hypothetical protein